MRVLFDHNLPHKLRISLGLLCEHKIVTASYMKWGKLKNGELLRMAESNGFQVFVTGDQSLTSEQNLARLQLAIIALSTNNWPIIKNYAPKILAAIDGAVSGSLRIVECGVFSRKKTPGGLTE